MAWFSQPSQQRQAPFANEQPPRVSYTRPTDELSDRLLTGIFGKVVSVLTDRNRPGKNTERDQVALFGRALNNRLQVQGEDLEILSESGIVGGRATKLKGVFKLAASTSYGVAVSPEFTVERTRAEVALHVAIISHLKHGCADAMISDQEVITALDFEPTDKSTAGDQGKLALAGKPVSSVAVIASTRGNDTSNWPGPFPTTPSDQDLIATSADVSATIDPGSSVIAGPRNGSCALLSGGQLPGPSPLCPGTGLPVLPPADPLDWFAEVRLDPASVATASAGHDSSESARSETVADITSVLGINAVRKAERILEIERTHGGFPSSGPDCLELNKLQFDAGECLRLLEQVRSGTLPVRSAQVPKNGIAEALNALRVDAERASSPGAGSASPASRSSSTEPRPRPVSGLTTEVVTILGEANKKFASCEWVRRHGIVPVVNGGEEAIVDDDGGNNCLLVSILQHATGDYADRFHAGMVKVLREVMVAKFPSIERSAPLHQDTEAIEWLRNTVNKLYGRDLQIVSIMLASNKNANGVAPLISHASAAGSEPVLIWEKGTHYEALVTADNAPATQMPSRLKELEKHTGEVQGRLYDTLVSASDTGYAGPLANLVVELNERLLDEMVEIRRQTGSIPSTGPRLSSSLVAEELLGHTRGPSQRGNPVSRVLNQIGATHLGSVARKNIANLNSAFLEKLACHRMSLPVEFHHLLTVETEFRNGLRPRPNWSSLIP